MMDTGNLHVIEPFPRKPRPPIHRDRKWIDPRDGVRLQHQLAISDVPSDAGIAQEARSEDPSSHGHKQNHENQISDGRKEKAEPGRRSCRLLRPGGTIVGTGFVLRVLRIQSMLAPNPTCYPMMKQCGRERPARAESNRTGRSKTSSLKWRVRTDTLQLPDPTCRACPPAPLLFPSRTRSLPARVSASIATSSGRIPCRCNKPA
jgi:hypothetical protein